MKRILFFILSMLPLLALADEVPVAIVTANGDGSGYQTITFKIVDRDTVSLWGSNASGGSYVLNSYEGGIDNPGWLSEKSMVNTVVIDSSFAKARPTTTRLWFSYMQMTDIQGIEYLNTSEVKDMSYMFSDCRHLREVDVSGFNTSKVTSMTSMFDRCKSLKSLDLSHFATSEVSNMSAMFEDCDSLKSLDLASFDTKNVRDMDRMFEGCESLRNVNISSFNTVRVTSMNCMFRFCRNLSSLDISGFDMSKVIDVARMFENCTGLMMLNVGSNDFVKVKENGNDYRPGSDYTKDLFSGIGNCYLKTADGFDSSVLGEASSTGTYKWINGVFTLSPDIPVAVLSTNAEGKKTLTFKAVDITTATIASGKGEDGTHTINPSQSGMFGTLWDWRSSSENSPLNLNFTSVIIEESFKNARPTSTAGWFSDMAAIDSIEGLQWLNTSEVEDMGSMFSNCLAIKSLDISNFDISKVTSAARMFYNCRALREINIGNVSLDSIGGELFGNVGTPVWPCYLKVDSAFDTSVLGEKTANNSYKWLGGYFSTEKNAYIPVAILSSNGENDKTLTFTFKDVDIVSDKVTSGNGVHSLNGYIGYMGSYEVYRNSTPTWLDDRKEITRVVIDSSFVSARPTTTYCWFSGMEKIKEIEGLPYLNTSDVTDMGSMFAACSSLASVDVGGFNTSKVEKISQIFEGCQSLTSLDISRFDMSNVSAWSMYGVMNGCKNLTVLNVGDNFSGENGTYFMNVGTPEKPCELVVGSEFDKSTLGSPDQNNVYHWSNGYFTEPVIGETVAIDSFGYAAYSTKNDIDISGNSDVQAFTAHYDKASQAIILTQVTKAPALTPLIFAGKTGMRTLASATTKPGVLANNDLRVSNTDFTSNGSQWFFARLTDAIRAKGRIRYANNSDKVGFIKVENGYVIRAGKVYLETDIEESDKNFIPIGDVVTGIKSLEKGNGLSDDGILYNLSGQRIDKYYKGIVIKNGKKVIVK